MLTTDTATPSQRRERRLFLWMFAGRGAPCALGAVLALVMGWGSGVMSILAVAVLLGGAVVLASSRALGARLDADN